MSVSRVSRGMRIGAFSLLLVGAWIIPGCANWRGGGTMMLLDDPPIRVKNQKLEVELFGGDVWDPAGGDDYKPKNKVESKDYIGVIAVKYSGDDYCEGEQPFQADSVTIEYGPATGGPKRKVTFQVDSHRKIVAKFPGANGHGTKKLEFGDNEADYLRLVVAKKHGGGHDFKCEAKPGDQLLVHLY
jgi:hypothetical protein